jgi:hypothetical protein
MADLQLGKRLAAYSALGSEETLASCIYFHWQFSVCLSIDALCFLLLQILHIN